MSEKEWLDIFADNLRSIMEDVGVSQRELADRIGVSESAISKYIHKIQMPGIRVIVNLAYALNCSTDELIDFGDAIA
jgi:transcriptional regulator with XRE-family HTH domain